MKGFILGVLATLIIGGWVTLAVVGIISVKTAILAPIIVFIIILCGLGKALIS